MWQRLSISQTLALYLLPMQTSPSTVYPSLQEHIVAVRLLHSVATEFSPHTSPGEADVMQSPLELNYTQTGQVSAFVNNLFISMNKITLDIIIQKEVQAPLLEMERIWDTSVRISSVE